MRKRWTWKLKEVMKQERKLIQFFETCSEDSRR